jgi:hypothetical protein
MFALFSLATFANPIRTPKNDALKEFINQGNFKKSQCFTDFNTEMNIKDDSCYDSRDCFYVRTENPIGELYAYDAKINSLFEKDPDFNCKTFLSHADQAVWESLTGVFGDPDYFNDQDKGLAITIKQLRNAIEMQQSRLVYPPTSSDCRNAIFEAKKHWDSGNLKLRGG